MIVWDAGVWAPMDDVEKSTAHRFLQISSRRARNLNGGWMLTRLKPKPGEDAGKKNWLLFKERDLAADTASSTSLPSEAGASNRDGGSRNWSKHEAAAEKPAKPVVLKPGALPGAVKAPLPSRIEPQLATQPKPAGGEGPASRTGEILAARDKIRRLPHPWRIWPTARSN